MAKLSEAERKKIIELIEAGKPLPSRYRSMLFGGGEADYVEATKDYRLVYQGKMSKEEVLRTTPAAPLQPIRSFSADNPFEDHWRNMLIFGDNLLALKAIYNDQQGPNLYRTKNKIKLIYIDPPFATKQDFMKDREKAYRDKVIGAQFIEFLRRRLILLREILADDGSIYVHLDTKKSHYIKAVMDEVFDETNFRNEIIWKRTSAHSDASYFANVHDVIFYYSKFDATPFNAQFTEYSAAHIEKRYKHLDPDGRRFTDGDLVATGLRGGGYEYVWKGVSRLWRCPLSTMERYEKENRLYYTRQGLARIKRYLDEVKGNPPSDVWLDVFPVNSQADERVNYPTQKSEQILERVICSSSSRSDIVLDAFMGSGTTPVVAEKLGRKWIGIDCGKLSAYTAQKRLLNLTTRVGSPAKNDSCEDSRVDDFEAHSKANSRGLLMIYEKARAGDLNITDGLLRDLAAFLENHLAGAATEEFSLVCPADKYRVKELVEAVAEFSAGEKAIEVGKVRFLISFIQPKEKPEKPKALKAKEFALYHAGIYDKELILNLPWEQYRPFVLQLFGVRTEPHKIRGLEADGYIGLHSAYLWDYPNHSDLVLDHGYIASLHEVMQGRGGDRFYVVAPGAAMAFMEDEIQIGGTTYVLLKVPLSVLMALIERGDVGSLKQPTNEASVNEVIDAVGYDFISQPVVEAAYTREAPSAEDLFNQKSRDFVIRLSDFRSNTLASDPEEFAPFETFSMVLVDTTYDGETFNLSRVFWADDILDADRKEAVVRLSQEEFTGESMMIIFMDKYGNELKVCKTPADFKPVRAARQAAPKSAKKKAAPRARSKTPQGKRKK